MLATSHMFAGAAIGRGVRRSWLALPLALASHYLLDVVPHLDSHALFGRVSGGPTRGEVTMAVLDTLVGISVVVVFAVALTRRKVPAGLLLAGAFLGIAPDIDNLPGIGQWLRAGPLAPAITFHHAIQYNVTPAQWPLGLGTQILVLLVSLWLLIRTIPTGAERRGTSRASAPSTPITTPPA